MTYKTLPKPPKSNRQVKEYVSAVKKGKNSRFVVPTKSGWVVKSATSRRATVSFSSKNVALARAKRLAQTSNGEVFVYNREGRLVERST